MQTLRIKFGKISQWAKQTMLVYGWCRHIFPKSPKENENSLNMSTASLFRKLMYRMPSRESARKPKENIVTLNMDSLVWENSKKLWKHSPAAPVPTALLVLPNFHSCLYNSIETQYMFSIS